MPGTGNAGGSWVSLVGAAVGEAFFRGWKIGLDDC